MDVECTANSRDVTEIGIIKVRRRYFEEFSRKLKDREWHLRILDDKHIVHDRDRYYLG